MKRKELIATGVAIGLSTRGEKAGVPVIGDNVYIGPGAKIIGRVNVGSGVAIGAAQGSFLIECVRQGFEAIGIEPSADVRGLLVFNSKQCLSTPNGDFR